METQSTRISKYVIKEVGKIAEDIGSPSDDTSMRHVIAEYKRLKLENELLRKNRVIDDDTINKLTLAIITNYDKSHQLTAGNIHPGKLQDAVRDALKEQGD